MITKKQAIEDTLKIWAKLADTGDAEKPSSALVAFHNGCPCCEYVQQRQGTIRCARAPSKRIEELQKWAERWSPGQVDCPLAGLWPNGCEEEDSPYYDWFDAVRLSDRRAAAVTIRNAAKKVLEDLNKTQNERTENDSSNSSGQ